MPNSKNKLWVELCKELPYSPAYAISHLIDPSIFHFFNSIDIANDDDLLTVYIIYDSNPDCEKLLIFDNGMGYTNNELNALIDYESVTAKGWKQWIRAVQWISNQTKVYTRRKGERYSSHLIVDNDGGEFTIHPITKLDPQEFISKTKFETGALFQIDVNKKWTKPEFSEIVHQVNKIYQKYVNLDKVAFKAIYRENGIFYDCNEPNKFVEVNSYRKAKILGHVMRPKLYTDENNEKRVLIQEKLKVKNNVILIKGYAGILNQPSFEHSGIYCYSSNKLVRGVLPYTSWKPKEIFGSESDNEHNVIIAELEFSNVQVNITGDDFIISETVQNKIAKLLASIIGEQGDLKSPKKLTTKVNTVYQNVSQSMPIQTVEQYRTVSEQIVDSLRTTQAIIDVNVETVKKNKREANVYCIKDEYGKEYNIQLIRATNKEANGCWIKKKTTDDGVISVYFNYEHPFLRPIISSKRSYNAFCEFVIYYIMAEERAIDEGAGVEELKLLIDNYLRKGNYGY